MVQKPLPRQVGLKLAWKSMLGADEFVGSCDALNAVYADDRLRTRARVDRLWL
jgi:hypothetical protein